MLDLRVLLAIGKASTALALLLDRLLRKLLQRIALQPHQLPLRHLQRTKASVPLS